jgi:hypothetical protein
MSATARLDAGGIFVLPPEFIDGMGKIPSIDPPIECAQAIMKDDQQEEGKDREANELAIVWMQDKSKWETLKYRRLGQIEGRV